MCTLCRAADPFGDEYSFHGTDAGPARDLAGNGISGMAAALPTFSPDQVARYLTHGYWQDRGGDARSFDTVAGGALTVDLSALAAGARGVARQALDAWSAVSDIVFEGVASGADITFRETGDGAYANTIHTGGTILEATVNVAAGWAKYGGYYLQTYLHEIGHALGLGHAGDYNGDADFATDAHYANDSWQMSVMSYFDQTDTPIDDGAYRHVDTPQMADILAIQSLYGRARQVRAEDTVYGDGADDPGMWLSGDRAQTLHDPGGTDLIDLSRRDHDQRLDLRPGQFSDIDGGRGNLGIARGTLIENARTGNGEDFLTGNAAANRIVSGGGDDVIRGGPGADRLNGRGGDDRLVGGPGRDELTGSGGDDRLVGGHGTDTAIFGGSPEDWHAMLARGTHRGGALTVVHAASGDRDRLEQVEYLAFGDTVLSVAEIRSELSGGAAGERLILSDMAPAEPRMAFAEPEERGFGAEARDAWLSSQAGIFDPA